MKKKKEIERKQYGQPVIPYHLQKRSLFDVHTTVVGVYLLCSAVCLGAVVYVGVMLKLFCTCRL